ncbi:hypothetical protein ACFE04_030679 [Oxalis oulophora]
MAKGIMEGSIAMNGGDGPYSYTKNSKTQLRIKKRSSSFKQSKAQGWDNAKELLIKSIQGYLTIDSKNTVFKIADLGCSVGPNTFTCVNTLIESVQHKFKTLGLESHIPEFQVFFNDRVTNDFNTLFKNLPSPRQYMAAGVPGSFYGRLFPEASMNFMNSSYTNPWLSKVPEEVTEEGSVSWNKGRISYGGSSNEVVEAYKAQFFKDMDRFLRYRSTELAEDGLLTILMPCRPNGTHPSESVIIQGFNWLGDALYDLAKEGMISEAQVDAFNLPVYFPSPSELKQVVSNIDHLSIEILEKISYHVKRSPDFVQKISFGQRAALQGILSEHFGSGVIDDLFVKHMEKIKEALKNPLFSYDDIENKDVVFLLVKRNTIS